MALRDSESRPQYYCFEYDYDYADSDSDDDKYSCPVSDLEQGSSHGESLGGEEEGVFGEWALFCMCGDMTELGRDGGGKRGYKRVTQLPPVRSIGNRGGVQSAVFYSEEDRDEDNRDDDDGSLLFYDAAYNTAENDDKSDDSGDGNGGAEPTEVAFTATLSAMSIDDFDDSVRDEFAAGIAAGLRMPREGVRVTSALAGSVIVKTSVSVAGGAAAASALASSLADPSAAGLGPLVDEVSCDGMATYGLYLSVTDSVTEL